MNRTKRRPRPVESKAADPLPASARTNTCDGCADRSFCGIDLEPDPKQPRLFDAEPATDTLTIH